MGAATRSPLIGVDPADHREAPMADCVLSSRVRLARNLIGFNFVNRSSPEQLADVVHRVQAARLGGPYEAGTRWVNVQATAALDRLMLFERNLISRPFVEAPHPRCVAISADETTSVMVNEEDHLRLQMLAPGMQLAPLAERMFELDRSLERSLEFAFHPRFGYLTACPTNLGTGIRVSAMMHLPALRMLEELDKVQRAAKDMHLAVRGFHGEGTEALGDFFQVSNQTTLGRSEHDLVEADVAEWHEYTIIAKGNHLVHQIDGKTTMELTDFEEAKRSLEGLIAFQIHRGPAMEVHIKDVMLKELPEGGVIDFATHPIPSDAQIIEAKAPKKGKKAAKAN